MTDPYAILGVAKGVSEADLKKAYRKLAKELHPDTNRDNPAAAERFAHVTAAYDLLSDKEKRGQFDRGEIDGDGQPRSPFGAGGNPFGGGFRPGAGGFSGDTVDLGDLFGGIFGGGRARGAGGGFAGGGFGGNPFGGQAGPAPIGSNVEYRLAVNLDEAARLAPQRITLKDGKTIDLKLPAGVTDGTQMRLAGKGEPGPGGNGDAIITISLRNHRHFTRDGDDIRLNLPITLTEALLGAKVRTPTADGAVMLNVSAGANSGQVLRLKGKGFTRKDGSRGDQLVTLMIDVPGGDADLQTFANNWTDPRDVRAGLA